LRAVLGSLIPTNAAFPRPAPRQISRENGAGVDGRRRLSGVCREACLIARPSVASADPDARPGSGARQDTAAPSPLALWRALARHEQATPVASRRERLHP